MLGIGVARVAGVVVVGVVAGVVELVVAEVVSGVVVVVWVDAMFVNCFVILFYPCIIDLLLVFAF